MTDPRQAPSADAVGGGREHSEEEEAACQVLCGATAPIQKFDTGPVVCDRPSGHLGFHSGRDADRNPFPCREWAPDRSTSVNTESLPVTAPAEVVLRDLRGRLERAEANLLLLAAQHGDRESTRLLGKASGVSMVITFVDEYLRDPSLGGAVTT